MYDSFLFVQTHTLVQTGDLILETISFFGRDIFVIVYFIKKSAALSLSVLVSDQTHVSSLCALHSFFSPLSSFFEGYSLAGSQGPSGLHANRKVKGWLILSEPGYPDLSVLEILRLSARVIFGVG